MGRASFQISTDEHLGYQDHARSGSLIANAVSSGLLAQDVEERTITLPEFLALLPVPVPTSKELEIQRIRQAAQDDTLTAVDRHAGLKLLLDGCSRSPSARSRQMPRSANRTRYSLGSSGHAHAGRER